MTAPINTNIKKKLSEIFSIAAIILLAIDIADTFVAQGGYGFLRLTDQQRGPLIGIPSIILFISFRIGYKQKSRFICNNSPRESALIKTCYGLGPFGT